MSSKQVLEQAKKLIPPLHSKFHKGQLGRVLVVGGSEDYTGAPYFAAMASALAGADMSHVMCTREAGNIIKTYSPNLMVHPYLLENGNTSLSSKIINLLERIHVVVLGPGLGRDETVFKQVSEIVAEVRRRQLPMVLDADGLFWALHNLGALKGADAILTPNVVELGRLVKAAEIDATDQQEQAEQLAHKLGVSLLVKGEQDIVTNGAKTLLNDTMGSPRRVSGQGDTLSGTLGTWLAWRQAYSSKLWDVEPIEGDLTLLAAYAASCIVRTASRDAFEEHGRSTVTTDVNVHVGRAFRELFEDKWKK